MTRFSLRRSSHAVRMHREFRRLAQAAVEQGVPGLLHSTILHESRHTCFSVSFWDCEPQLSTHMPAHIEAASRVFSRLRIDADHGPEIWSTLWRLEEVSNNLYWPGFDLGSLIGRTPASRSAPDR